MKRLGFSIILLRKSWVLLTLVLFLIPGWAHSEGAPVPQKEGLSSWKVVKRKTLPNFKVEILERWTMGKFPRVDSMKARIVPVNGGSVTEFNGTWLTPDPREFVVDWKKSDGLDMTGDGLEDLVIRNSTGGAHCCYSYTIFSLAKELQRIGKVELQDCGEKIRLQDLNGNGKPEILSCDAKFTYLGDLPYSESPFPPAIYTLGKNGYERADQAFKQVFLADIARQREILKQGYRPAAALQIVTDYFLMGDENKGWEEFNTLYQGKDKERIKLQLLQKLGLTIPIPESETKASPPAPVPGPAPAPATTDALP